MIPFTFVQTVKTVVGPGSVSCIGELVHQAGYHKAFLVYDAGVQSAGLIGRIEDSLHAEGVPYTEFSDVMPNPPSAVVDAAFERLSETSCDCIIAIGGGSSIDTAKGINILRNNGRRILDYTEQPIESLCCGLIAIPTTAGTGSEFSTATIITDSKTHVKKSIVSPLIAAEYAILDPEMTVGMPKGLTMMTGLDAMSHAMEAYTSRIATPISDLVCEKIIETVFEFLPRAVSAPDDMEARTNMLMAASMGGWMLAVAGAHLGHSVAHTIGAKYNIPHGAACAYAVPAMLDWLQERKSAKLIRIGRILGAKIKRGDSTGIVAQKVKDAYRKFRDEAVGLKPIGAYLGDANPLDELDFLAELALEDGMTVLAPEAPTTQELRRMIEATFLPAV